MGMNGAKILKRAQDVLDIEAQGILALIDRLDQGFVRALL